MSKKHHGRQMNENEEVVGGGTPITEAPVVEPVSEPTPESGQTEPEVIAGQPPADPSTYEVEKTDPRPIADEALENLRVGFETLKTHSAAKIPGSLIHDAAIPLEKAYLAFKKLMNK